MRKINHLVRSCYHDCNQCNKGKKKYIYQILSDVNSSGQPIIIKNNRGKNGVLISEDGWNAIQETLYLNSIPGMVESIIDAGNEPLEECSII